MENKFYIDSDAEKKIDSAISKAIANLYLEGIYVTEEEKEKFKEEFLKNFDVKVLKRK